MDSTMITCDSVATCVNKMTTTCQSCVKGTEINWLDVVVVGIICGTILLLAIIAVVAYFIHMDKERKALEEAAIIKKEEEKNSLDNKQKADADSLKQNRHDHLLKRKEELENKMHGYMESQIKNGVSLSKDDMYIAELLKEINELKSALNDKKA